jgi:hypothetical protein
MASYINMANEIFQSIRPCRYFICCPNIWNPTINMNIIPDALTPTRRLPRPSRRRGEVRRLVPAASGRFGLPASPWVHLVLWRRPASWALLIARPARGGCCADSLSCELF